MIAGFLWITEQSELEQCFSVRKKVFMEEQGFHDEFDEIDDRAHHILFLDDDKPVGTARLFLYENEWHIGRVCVLKEYRGQGIGKFMVQEAVCKARELGQSKVLSLSAQVRVKDFYEKLGFKQSGEQLYDEGCPHIPMKIEL